MEPKDAKALKRGLFWLGMAIIAAVLSGASNSDIPAFIAFVLCVAFSFLAYLFLMVED
jgi:hypothetical protein